jgi:signal peptidase II
MISTELALSDASHRAKALKFFLIAAAVIIIDQIVKVAVKTNMVMGEAGQIHVIGDFFKIYFIENNGAAFGLTVGKLLSPLGIHLSEETGKIILSVFSIIAVFAIGYVLYRLASHRSPLPIFVALIFGGALGNIIDRTFYGLIYHEMNNYEGGLLLGRVVDMFYFDMGRLSIGNWHMDMFPIFNIADSCISVGIVVILIFQGKFFKMDEQSQLVAADPTQTASAIEIAGHENGPTKPPTAEPESIESEQSET